MEEYLSMCIKKIVQKLILGRELIRLKQEAILNNKVETNPGADVKTNNQECTQKTRSTQAEMKISNRAAKSIDG